VTEEGIDGFGGLFEYDITSGNFSTVVTFDGYTAGKGGTSRTTLMQATDGKLYGMTGTGGAAQRGVLFSYNPVDGDYQVKVNFEFDNGGGIWPFGSVVQGSNGKIYGTTYTGGANRGGTLFEYDITNGIYTKKVDFISGTGVSPSSNMLLASNGNLYGVTSYGGLQNVGVIFEYDPSINSYTKKIDFQSADGNPAGALIQIPNGKMYGVANISGSTAQAMLFEYDPTGNTLTKKIDFNVTVDGNTPSGTLLYSDGKIYGLMRSGGAHNMGTLFEFDPTTGMSSKLKDFDGTNYGGKPVGSLIKAKNNKLYGVTQSGGTFNVGTIFEYDPATGDLNKKFDFTEQPLGISHIYSSLVESANGKLYGTTFEGGNQNFGVLYEFDITSNTYTKKHDFRGIDGARIRAPLLFVSMEEQTITFASIEEKTYGDNPFVLDATASSGLDIIYTSSNPAVASVNGNMVTIHGAGSTTITASQAGSFNLHSASVSQVLTINKANQIITFNSIPEKTSVDDPFNLSAFASSGLPVTYISDNSTVAAISGNLLTINSDGTAVITATQPGDANYNAATDVSQTLTVIFVLSSDDPLNPLVKLYPNPAYGEFIIEHDRTRPLDTNNLVVFDYIGRSWRIPLEMLEDGRFKCTTGQLPAGLYFVVIPGHHQPKAVMIIR
jgi:uncharacterized repeat protein (TIGR03803 family)